MPSRPVSAAFLGPVLRGRPSRMPALFCPVKIAGLGFLANTCKIWHFANFIFEFQKLIVQNLIKTEFLYLFRQNLQILIHFYKFSAFKLIVLNFKVMFV
jgi:hypothetical protein